MKFPAPLFLFPFSLPPTTPQTTPHTPPHIASSLLYPQRGPLGYIDPSCRRVEEGCESDFLRFVPKKKKDRIHTATFTPSSPLSSSTTHSFLFSPSSPSTNQLPPPTALPPHPPSPPPFPSFPNSNAQNSSHNSQKASPPLHTTTTTYFSCCGKKKVKLASRDSH